jgi:hypothetical protein
MIIVDNIQTNDELIQKVLETMDYQQKLPIERIFEGSFEERDAALTDMLKRIKNVQDACKHYFEKNPK